MRHAFDADHIAAIDNTTRKLMADGRRPLSVGFWFSLGHSSVVFGLVAAARRRRAVAGRPGRSRGDSALQHVTGLVGLAISGTFLLLIGLVNLAVLRRILGCLARHAGAAPTTRPSSRRTSTSAGFLNRILGRFTRAVRKPWHMYPVGLLFGLGFDTATEVALLVLAGGRGGLRAALVRAADAAGAVRRRA